MTALEIDFIKRALAALEAGEHSPQDQYKMLQTISEISGRAANKVQHKIEDMETA